MLISLPLVSELPIIAGKLNRLIAFNLLDTALSIILLAIGCLWGVQGAAASRLVYGVLWLCIYVRFMHSVVQFDTRALLRIYAKSGLATASAVIPLALTYLLWASPSQIGFGALAASVLAGGLCWFGALILVRHPALDDFLAIAATLPLGRFLRFPATAPR